MNILQAIRDENLFRPFLGEDLTSWRNWLTALQVLYGVPLIPKYHDVVRQCTGRDAEQMPQGGFDTALFLTGRRSGKSRIAAIIGAYEALLAGGEESLAKGERGIVAVCSPTKSQSRIVKDYLRAIFDTPMLAPGVREETKTGFRFENGVRIEILTGDWRTIRGFTLLAAIIDEVCFFGFDEESKVRSDTELVRAIQPALASVGGKLVAISSPYAKRGWSYRQYLKNFANEDGRTLIWNAPSRVMNPMLPQSVVDAALAEDLQAAKSEYLGEFRDDVGAFVDRSMLDRLVVQGRAELPPLEGRKYYAFCDVSGGRGDDATLAIAHRDGRNVVLDLLRRWRPPFSPQLVIQEMAADLRHYGIRYIHGDCYGAEFTARAFRDCRIKYATAVKPKSQLYVELLPKLCSGEVELLDCESLLGQLAALERRTRSGGKDVVDHPRGGHDDLANAVAGVVEVVTTVRRVGCRPTYHHLQGAWL